MVALNYEEAVSYLMWRSDIERARPDQLASVESTPPRFNLERVRKLLEAVGNPQDCFECVHIAGTKGKGSTAALIESVLRSAGQRTGLFTSPHLHRLNERVRVDGAAIADGELAAIADRIQPACVEVQSRWPQLGELTTFELLTALAFVYFAERRVQIAVVETGMGGRLDATNVIEPLACVITPVSLDHTEYLGGTLAEIANEKAGIIKFGVPVAIAPQPEEVADVIAHAADTMGATSRWAAQEWAWEKQSTPQGLRMRLSRGPQRLSLEVPLRGDHQAVNVAVALTALDLLVERGVPITKRAILEGMASVWWPGRLELVAEGPRTMVDGAHNPHSAASLRESLRELGFNRLVLVFGCLSDKDIAGIVAAIVPAAHSVIVTRPRHPRAVYAEMLESLARVHVGDVRVAGSVGEAVAQARSLAGPKDLVLATGSLSVAAEAREACGLIDFESRFVPAGTSDTRRVPRSRVGSAAGSVRRTSRRESEAKGVAQCTRLP